MMADTWIRSLIVDGIIGGVGGVLVFVPNILLLFLAIAFIEDSGYMARVAFVVDRVMQYVGLHGKSFIPMLIGFGCTVPAMMAARTIDDRKNRLTTILIAPLMSCSARLPVYLLLTGAFFAPHVAGKVIFSLYLLGVLLAVIVAFILRKVVLPGDTTPFVMELPPYRMPTIRGLAIHTWERTWHYVKKAGTVILAASVIVWFLSTYPAPPDHVLTASDGAEVSAVEYTYAGRVAKTFEPLIRPLGFDYKVGIALIAGFAAKEAVVSTLGTVYKVGEPDEEIDEHDPGLRGALRADPNFSPLVAYTLMVFVLIYVPCIAVIAVVRKETNSWKWPLFLIAYTCSLAWIVSFIVYQGGRLLGF
jgi:ferrous iron transport protein B